jgi:hypothetical protein
MTHFPHDLPVVSPTAIAPNGHLNGAAMESQLSGNDTGKPGEKTLRKIFGGAAILDWIFRHKTIICTLRSGGLTFASDRYHQINRATVR